jgi:hypothetical protein
MAGPIKQGITRVLTNFAHGIGRLLASGGLMDMLYIHTVTGGRMYPIYRQTYRPAPPVHVPSWLRKLWAWF